MSRDPCESGKAQLSGVGGGQGCCPGRVESASMLADAVTAGSASESCVTAAEHAKVIVGGHPQQVFNLMSMDHIHVQSNAVCVQDNKST